MVFCYTKIPLFSVFGCLQNPQNTKSYFWEALNSDPKIIIRRKYIDIYIYISLCVLLPPSRKRCQIHKKQSNIHPAKSCTHRSPPSAPSILSLALGFLTTRLKVEGSLAFHNKRSNVSMVDSDLLPLFLPLLRHCWKQYPTNNSHAPWTNTQHSNQATTNWERNYR